MVKLPFSSTAPPQWEPAEASPVACMIVFVSQCVWLCVFWVQRMDGSTTAFFFFTMRLLKFTAAPSTSFSRSKILASEVAFGGQGPQRLIESFGETPQACTQKATPG